MLAVVLYTLAPGAGERVAEVYPRHRAYLDAFRDVHDELVLIGPFAGGPGSGSMAIFLDRPSAEAFVADDPFVLEGVAGTVEVRDWIALDFIGLGSDSGEEGARTDAS